MTNAFETGHRRRCRPATAGGLADAAVAARRARSLRRGRDGGGAVRRRFAVRTGVLLVLALGGMAAVLTSASPAAAWGRKQVRVKTPLERKVPPRFDSLPSMSYAAGTLQRGATGWKVGPRDVEIPSFCRIGRADQAPNPGALVEGVEVAVMGSEVGGRFVAWRVDVKPPSWAATGLGSTLFVADEERIVWSETDPDVGVGTGPR
ncbi:MAG: hypothetical protein R6X25_01790 [Candidatus Krumholzibacteriia bacterium]